MSTSRANDAADDGLAAAVRRFPAHARQISDMLRQSESFSGLCADLGVAELALVTVERLPASLRAERRADFEALVEGLVAEIDDALRKANVVSIAAAKRRYAPPGEER